MSTSTINRRALSVPVLILSIAALLCALLLVMPSAAHASVTRTKVSGSTTNNCVLWARTQVPSLPYNLGTYVLKQKICNLSSSATPHAGDVAVMRNSDSRGHVAVVTKVSGKSVTIREAGWIKGYITQATGTASALGIYGYYCPGGSGHSNGYNPQGCVDSASGGYGTVTVSGWVFDRDAPSTSTQVHVYVGGPAGSGEGHPINANLTRNDVNKAYAAYGISGKHGFSMTFTTKKTGKQTLYFYGINKGAGENSLVATKTVTIKSGDPVGCVDSVTSTAKGKVNVRGWAFDYNAKSTSLKVHVYVGGPAGSASAEGHIISANVLRSDVNKVYSLTGNHGFNSTFSTKKTGKQTLYFYAINVGAGVNNTYLGCKTVTIK